MLAALQQGAHVVVDRCNFDASQRAHWIRLSRALARNRVMLTALQLMLPLELCKERARSRPDHPTLGPHNCDEVIDSEQPPPPPEAWRRAGMDAVSAAGGGAAPGQWAAAAAEEMWQLRHGQAGLPPGLGLVAHVGAVAPGQAAHMGHWQSAPAGSESFPSGGGGGGGGADPRIDEALRPPAPEALPRPSSSLFAPLLCEDQRARPLPEHPAAPEGARRRGDGHKEVVARLRNLFADPSSRLPYDVPQEPGAPADPRVILLFDLNGTLTSHTSVRKAQGITRLRPGTSSLLRLKERFRLGIYTSSTVRTAHDAIAQLEAAAGGELFERKLVLHREHTVPAPPGHVDAGGDPWDTLKPLKCYFAALHRVILVDDDAYKSIKGEEASMLRIPCWQDADVGCTVLQSLTDLLLELVAALPQEGDVRTKTADVSARLHARVKSPMDSSTDGVRSAPAADGPGGLEASPKRHRRSDGADEQAVAVASSAGPLQAAALLSNGIRAAA
ncbi:hypothetical protein GPECTOR_60g773 [Gonium pectorale]|uniref:Mitochondrial import inner membrane translocase subunit TIM50 n=1 Tax=Gonium pectorale TaxID=33097 RepID=A0A150G598_GONPE|nr:hypothetical protein GPECTOR_60g773 [Gonium pectorale]|eukprot:KXZ44994.1 hypothetical protein GPECTOR_60g773 [Gonium pectorale]